MGKRWICSSPCSWRWTARFGLAFASARSPFYLVQTHDRVRGKGKQLLAKWSATCLPLLLSQTSFCHRCTEGRRLVQIQNSPQRLIHIQIHHGHIFVTSLRISRTHPSFLFRTRAPGFIVFLSAGDRVPPWSSPPWSGHPGTSMLSTSLISDPSWCPHAHRLVLFSVASQVSPERHLLRRSSPPDSLVAWTSITRLFSAPSLRFSTLRVSF